jgi:hypothetical protein
MGYLGGYSWVGTVGFACGRFFRGRLLGVHFGIKLEDFFEAFGVVFEAATDVDAFEDFVVAFVGFAQVGGHGFGVIEIGDRFPSDF